MSEFVMKSPLIMRWGRACLATVLLTLATLCASAAATKRVPMVFREESHVPAMAVSSTEQVPPGVYRR